MNTTDTTTTTTNTNTNADRFNTRTPELFMLSALPWIEEVSGLKRIGKLELPKLFPVGSTILVEGQDGHFAMASGLYDHHDNTIAFNANGFSQSYVESTLVHELVHFLQNDNGIFHESDGEEEVGKQELLAYQVQSIFLSTIHHEAPETYGLTKEFVEQVTRTEVKPVEVNESTMFACLLNMTSLLNQAKMFLESKCRNCDEWRKSEALYHNPRNYDERARRSVEHTRHDDMGAFEDFNPFD